MATKFLVFLGFLLLTAAVDEDVDIDSRNGRGQIPEGPNTNCMELEKQFGLARKLIRLPHEYDCTRFYECADKELVEKTCSDRYRTRYDPFQKRCDWNSKTKCLNYMEYLAIVGMGQNDGCGLWGCLNHIKSWEIFIFGEFFEN